MNISVFVIILMVCIQVNAIAADLPCISDMRVVYKNFLSSLIGTNKPGTGCYVVIETEKNYYSNKKSDTDTVTNIYTIGKRVKMYNRNFTIHSDGKAYLAIFPAIKKIAIQKIINHNGNEIKNPIEKINEISDLLISENNYQSCKEFTDKKRRRCLDLILKFPTTGNKYSPIENLQYIMDVTHRSLISIAIRYKSITDLKEEKYTFLDAKTDYVLPWDLLCPLEQTIFDKDDKPKNEYKKYNIIDLRKSKPIIRSKH